MNLIHPADLASQKFGAPPLGFSSNKVHKILAHCDPLKLVIGYGTATSTVSQEDADSIAAHRALEDAIVKSRHLGAIYGNSRREFTASCNLNPEITNTAVVEPCTIYSTSTAAANLLAESEAARLAVQGLVCPEPDVAVYLGVSILVRYIQSEAPGHQCDSAAFDVMANGITIGTANLNNSEDGGDRTGGPFVITQEQAEQFTGTEGGMLKLEFICNMELSLPWFGGGCHNGVGRVTVTDSNEVVRYDGYPTVGSGTYFVEIPLLDV